MSREVELGSELWELEQKKKALNEQLKGVADRYKQATGELMQVLIDEGKNSTGHIEGVGEFAIKPRSFLSVNKANMPRFVEHLREEGHDSLIKETVEAPTLKAYLDTQHKELCARLAEDQAFFTMTCTALGIEDPGATTYAEVAAKQLGRLGVSEFTETKISHTKKGK